MLLTPEEKAREIHIIAGIARRAADDIDSIIRRIDEPATKDCPELGEGHEDLSDVYTEGPRLAIRLRVTAQRLYPIPD